jgi:regulator of nonsense transcripts 1
MDSFDNFQYDSASSYGGGMGIVDDTSSVYTANTNNHTSIDLESLAISDSLSHSASANTNGHQHNYLRSGIDEDFDAVLDDLKDDGVVDLPPHACRCVQGR